MSRGLLSEWRLGHRRRVTVGLHLFEKLLNFRLGYPNSLQYGTHLAFATKLGISPFHGVPQNKHELLRLGAKNLT